MHKEIWSVGANVPTAYMNYLPFNDFFFHFSSLSLSTLSVYLSFCTLCLSICTHTLSLLIPFTCSSPIFYVQHMLFRHPKGSRLGFLLRCGPRV